MEDLSDEDEQVEEEFIGDISIDLSFTAIKEYSGDASRSLYFTSRDAMNKCWSELVELLEKHGELE